jgi:hypothetical protein
MTQGTSLGGSGGTGLTEAGPSQWQWVIGLNDGRPKEGSKKPSDGP